PKCARVKIVGSMVYFPFRLASFLLLPCLVLNPNLAHAFGSPGARTPPVSDSFKQEALIAGLQWAQAYISRFNNRDGYGKREVFRVNAPAVGTQALGVAALTVFAFLANSLGLQAQERSGLTPQGR